MAKHNTKQQALSAKINSVNNEKDIYKSLWTGAVSYGKSLEEQLDFVKEASKDTLEKAEQSVADLQSVNAELLDSLHEVSVKRESYRFWLYILLWANLGTAFIDVVLYTLRHI